MKGDKIVIRYTLPRGGVRNTQPTQLSHSKRWDDYYFFFFQRKGNDIDGNVEKGKISNIRERESLSIQQQLYAAVKRERRRNNENEIYGCYTVNKASYVVRPRLFLIHTCTVYILTLFEVVRMCIRRESHFHPRTNHFLRFFATFIVSRLLSLSRKYAWKELLNSRLFRYHSIDTAGIENGRHVCCAGWTGEMMVWTYPRVGLRPLHHVILPAHIVQSDALFTHVKAITSYR